MSAVTNTAQVSFYYTGLKCHNKLMQQFGSERWRAEPTVRLSQFLVVRYLTPIQGIL